MASAAFVEPPDDSVVLMSINSRKMSSARPFTPAGAGGGVGAACLAWSVAKASAEARATGSASEARR